MLRGLSLAWVAFFTLATLHAQQAPETVPEAALREALTAACRQSEEQFARYLTADNGAAFRGLAAGTRTALMKRFSLLEEPGQPLLSSDPQGRTVIRCESAKATAETRMGETRLKENLAFISVEVRAPGELDSATGQSPAGRRAEFGMVREGGSWKLLSVGLLLLDLAALAREWEQTELEAKEKSAIAALREMAQAIGTYRRAFGRMPQTLAQLGPAKGGISPEAAGLLDTELAAGRKDGYVFRCLLFAELEEGAALRFELAAIPAEYGKTGRRSFFLDASGTVRGRDKQGAAVTASDPPIEPR